MVYDSLKTVVDRVLEGKDRQFNKRFMAMAAHYMFEPVACTLASGWEKGQVENQVGNIREWLFTPCLRLDKLRVNIAYAIFVKFLLTHALNQSS